MTTIENPTKDNNVSTDKTPAKNSMLNDLKAALTATIERDPLTLKVPSRPTISIRYKANLTSEQLNQWRKQSTRFAGTSKEEFDAVKFSGLVLAWSCEAILFHGEEQFDEEKGTLLTFASKATQDIVGASNTLEAVKKVYGVDGHILASAGEITDAAGFGDEIEREDPTTTS